MASNLWFGTPVLAGVGASGIAYCRFANLGEITGTVPPAVT